MANPSGLSHVYVGAAARIPGSLGGIFRQTVGSDQWELLDKGLPERADVQAITIHPTDANVIFAGSLIRVIPGPSTSVPRRSRSIGATTAATVGASSLA